MPHTDPTTVTEDYLNTPLSSLGTPMWKETLELNDSIYQIDQGTCRALHLNTREQTLFTAVHGPFLW